MRRLISLFLLIALVQLVASAPVQAQTGGYASLTADRIVYTSGYRVLRASGNVVIIFGNSRLEASALTYDEKNDLITAEGPIRLTDGDNLTIIASFAELSGDMKTGILKSARMVLNQQLQLSAVEISRSEGRYNQLHKAAASTCTVSVAHPTPFWQVRARRIVHDEERQLLFFEHAQLRIGNVPVAYVPRLRVPDPSVRRATGFLVPGFNQSSSLGYGVNAPYFIALGDYADVTLIPFIYSTGTATLGFDFRKRFHNGSLNVKGAISNDTVAATPVRGYLFADANFSFQNGIVADIGLQFTSDESFLSDHSISKTTRLDSHIRLSRTRRTSYIWAEVQGFHSLSTTIASDEIPFLLGEAGMMRRWVPGALGGQMGFEVSANSYTRTSVTDIVGRDTLRVSSVADWRRQWISGSGLVFATMAELHADYYRSVQDSTFPAPISRAVPIAAAEFRLPLMRESANATEVIEPRVQLVWSSPTSATVPDEDSSQVEFEATDLFALNHFAGIDQIERGLRANIGVSYTRKSESGWNVDAVIGKVVRAADYGQFTPASGLDGSQSSYVLAGQVILPSRFLLLQRMVFNTGLAVSKNETKLAYINRKFDVATSYLWLASGAAGNVTAHSEWTFDGGVNFGGNWRTAASWRYDLIADAASEAGVALTYRNDCIKVDLSLSRTFAASSNVGASTNLGLQVSLEGFGSRAGTDSYGRKCSDF